MHYMRKKNSLICMHMHVDDGKQGTTIKYNNILHVYMHTCMQES